MGYGNHSGDGRDRRRTNTGARTRCAGTSASARSSAQSCTLGSRRGASRASRAELGSDAGARAIREAGSCTDGTDGSHGAD